MDHKLITASLIKVKVAFKNLPFETDLTQDAITVTTKQTLSEEQSSSLRQAAESMLCWRKGPYSLFDLYIDSEWQDFLKWQRIKPLLEDLEGKDIADIGCNNGYYLFKLLGLNPRSLTGFDPYKICYYQFQLINSFISDPRLKFILAGVENLNLFPNSFDLILFMGVLYHRKNPVAALEKIKSALKANGSVILETLILPGDRVQPIQIEGRYSKMNNIYYLSSINGLLKWLKEAGFQKTEIISISQTSSFEQRVSEFAPYESLANYLDPDDYQKTIEGLPAPRRILIQCS